MPSPSWFSATTSRSWTATGNGLLAGGHPEQCGWLRDKYGLCWQIVPAGFLEMMIDRDKDKAKRAVEAMMKMVKFDIAELKRAFDGR